MEDKDLSKDKTIFSGNTDLLLLTLLSQQDMYGYQIISELSRQSNNVFELKAGTLYPLLHQLQSSGYIESYEDYASSGKKRKYYHITAEGRKQLSEREKEWETYSTAIAKILSGRIPIANI